MSFGLIQNGMLLGLVALAIPVIIHLMFRRRPRQVQIGSVRFLQQVIEKHRNRRRVMRWLLMSLRLAGVALLAFLFARPFLVENSQRQPGERFVAVLIDGSASMQLRTQGNRAIDVAVQQARKVINTSDERTQYEIAFFDHEVTPVSSQNLSGDPLAQLTAPSDSYAPTDYAPAFRWAHDVCTAAKARSKEVHVFTDLQQSGLAWSEVEPMPADVLVKVHDLGRDLPNNVAITHSTPEQLTVRPGESTNLVVSLLNAGPFTLDETPVVLDIKNGSRTIHKRQKVQLEPGGIEKVRFELPQLEDGLWRGHVAVELIDDLLFDNRRHLAIMSAPQYRVLVVDGQTHETDFLSETYHLQSALRLAPKGASYDESPYVPVVNRSTAPLSEYDVVILANVTRVSERDASRLMDFVSQGGGLVVFCGAQVHREGYQAMADIGLSVGELVASRETFGLPWRIEQWDQTHSIFAPFADPQHGDLRRLAFRGITELIPLDDVAVVARFHDGKPFLLERRIGDAGGSVVWLTTSCDNQWSQWTQTELYLPIVHQVLGHVTGLNGGGPVQEELIDTTTEALVSKTPGVYRRNRSWQVVNVNPRESETERCSIDDFVSRFQLNISQSDEPLQASTAMFGNAPDVRHNEVWHWILFALLIVIVTEFLVANRTAA